jgi:hypothetical protein
MTYEFRNEGALPVKLDKTDLTVPLFVNSSSQTVLIINSSSKYKVSVVDDDGNMGAVMSVEDTLLPGGVIGFNVSYLIKASSINRPSLSLDEAQGFDTIPPSLVDKYVVVTETFMVNDLDIKSKAEEVAGGEETVLGAVTKLIEYVTSSTTYQNFETPQYPNVTLNTGRGDCDDQSILLISMARSLGIPSYLEVGIVINPAIQDSESSWGGHLSNSQDGVGWHGWAMLYVPPWGWTPVDLTLTSAKTGLELMQKAPEYDSNVVKCFDVNLQGYVSDAIYTRNRIMNSTIYVALTDKVGIVKPGNGLNLNSDSLIILGLGLAVTVAIVLMFKSGSRRRNL